MTLNNKMHTLKTGAAGVLLSLPLMAGATGNMDTSTQSFSVRLNASRVIYDPASNGTTLTVTSPQDYPILVQSEVLNEDMKSKAPFVVTPPLMRLDGQQSSRLRIVRTGGNFAADRESLQWLCVKGIPPKADDAWAKGKDGKPDAGGKVSLNVQLSINNCIKLFVRPASVKGHSDDVADKLRFERAGGQLKAMNDSPFYMNLSSLKVNGTDVKDTRYVSPFSSRVFSLPAGKNAGKVEWKIVNDYGGESRTYQADIR